MRRFQYARKPPKVKRMLYHGNRVTTQYVRRSYLPALLQQQRGQGLANLNANRNNADTTRTTGREECEIEGTSFFLNPDQVTYKERKTKLLEKWQSIRHDMLSTRIEEMCPSSYICVMCGTHAVNIILCETCGPSAFYCDHCCHRVHRPTLFHKPKKWTGCFYSPFIMERKLNRSDHSCDQQYTTNIYVVDNEGQQHDCIATFCKCEEPAVTFIRYNLWPATPTNPKVGFSLRFMELLAVLQLECHMPAKTFCDALQHMRTFSFSLVAEGRNIYRALVGDCLAEYNFHRSCLSTRHLITDTTFGRECPVCEKEPAIVSMNANFGLVHKTSSGEGHGQLSSRHEDLFFQEHADIKIFMNDYDSDKKSQTSECSNFQAGNAIRYKMKSNKLDIKGVFGSVCKHDIPVLMLDMFHGERLGYPTYIIKKVLENRSEKLLVMYDIACTLHKHFQKNNCIEVLQKCTFAVPVFHSFAHNVACQLEYGQRFAPGTGLTDGEGIERLWSYLRGFKKITKEMSVNNRQDLLTDALLHHSSKVINNLAFRLKEKLSRATATVEESEKLLASTLEEENASPTSVANWMTEWKQSTRKRSKKGLTLTVDEQYVNCLQQLKDHSNMLDKLEDAEEIMKKQQEISRWPGCWVKGQQTVFH